MELLAWTALFAPAAAVVAIGLLGDRVDRCRAGLIAAGATGLSFLCTLGIFVDLLGREPEERTELSTLWTWLTAGDLRVGAEILIDPLSVFMMLVVTGVGFLILVYAIGYMAGDLEERRYHAYKALFVFSMLLLVMAGNLLLLLAGWGLVGLSSYLLINYWHQRPGPGGRGQEGVHHERRRRRDLRARALHPRSADRLPRLRHRLRGGTGGARGGVDARRARRARAPGRRGRQVRAGSAPHLAPGRDGGPDAGQRPHPRGDDGDRRRLPDRAHEPALRAGDRRAGARGDPRSGHAPRRRADRARTDGHQAGHRLLDDEPDRLHVRRRRARRLRRGHVPPDDARLLQGAVLHGRRRRHPRALRRAGHPQHGRARRASCPGPTARSSSARWRWPRSRPSPASSPRTRSSSSAIDSGSLGVDPLGIGIVGRVPDRRSTRSASCSSSSSASRRPSSASTCTGSASRGRSR